MDLELLRDCLEPAEVYEKRPARRRGGSHRRKVPDEVRMALYAVQRGVCPGCGFHQPHYLRFEADHIVALSDDGKTERRNLHCSVPCFSERLRSCRRLTPYTASNTSIMIARAVMAM